jgi:hypothetical protein
VVIDVAISIVVEAFCWLFDWGPGREERRTQRQNRKAGTSHE